MKKKLCALLTMVCMLISPITAKAVDFNVVPTTKCESYVDVSSVQLSKVTDKMLPVTMTLISTDEHGKDYFFKVSVPSTSMVNLCFRYESTLRWKYNITVYSDSTCTNVVYKDEETDFGKFENVVLYLTKGDYYVKMHNTYNKEAVIETFPSKMIDKTTTTTTGASVTVKVPNPALYESNDPNIFYNLDSTTKKETFTVNNILDISAAYTPLSDMVDVKTKYINNVCTVSLDASDLYTSLEQNGQCYIQMRNDKVAGQSTYDNPDIWDLDVDNWYNSDSEYTDVYYYPYDSVNPTGRTDIYIDKSGWYSFRIAPVRDADNLFAVVKVLYVDVTSPKVSGVTNGKIYKETKTVKFSDDSKGVGILKATCNGKTISSGKKFSTDGKYVIRAYDKNKNLTKVTFYVDKKKPVVSGVKNGAMYKSPVTVKFSDAGSGVKSATLNGKVIKSGTKVSSKGNYTVVVKDKAGRSTTVRFSIK